MRRGIDAAVTLSYVGRAVVLRPGNLGILYHKRCTVTQVNFEPPSYLNGFRKRMVAKPIPMYWYTTDKATGERAFCTYSGYGDGIETDLVSRGFLPESRELVSDGLGPPAIEALKEVQWRPGQRAVMAKLMTYRRGVIVCPTAFGKTFMVKQLAKAYPTAQIIITVPQADVAKAIYADLVQTLGTKIVGMIGAGKYEPRRVIVAVSKSLERCPPEANLVLVDECHSILTESYIKMLNRFRRARLFGFTATPTGRSDRTDGFLEAVFGPILHEVGYQDGVSAGNIVQIKARVYPVPVGPQVDHIQNKVKQDRFGLWSNHARNEVVARAARDAEAEFGPEAQILIMVDKVEHAFHLGQLLPEYALVSGPVDPAAQVKFRAKGIMSAAQTACTPGFRDEARKAFESNTLKRCIATMVWKQGVDFRDLAVLIRADGMATPIGSGQIPGRLSRLGRETEKTHGLLIDFDDRFSTVLNKRYLSRLRVYKGNGWEVELR